MQFYLVGGAVRDQLLNRTVKERDWVVVGATRQQMLALGYKQVGKDFPVFLHPETGEEYALARTERKIGKGYTGFACHASPTVSLHDDLLRRDFTINAIAQDESGNIIDPFNGQADLKNHLLRHISPAFAEDPVRILRGARFAARFGDYPFIIAPETNQLMQQMVQAGEVEALVPERVWQELSRALLEITPSRFFTVLRDCNALRTIFPEIANLYGVPNPQKWHPEIDTGVHTMMVLDQAARLNLDGPTRFATLLHDVGKALTAKENLPSHPGHETAGVALIKQFCARFRTPRNYRDLAILVGKYHTHCHRAQELTAKTLLRLLENLDAFRRRARFIQFLQACEADSRGRTGFADKAYPQADYLQQVLDVASQVDAKQLAESGLTGNEIALELHRQRLAAIKRWMQSDRPATI